MQHCLGGEGGKVNLGILEKNLLENYSCIGKNPSGFTFRTKSLGPWTNPWVLHKIKIKLFKLIFDLKKKS